VQAKLEQEIQHQKEVELNKEMWSQKVEQMLQAEVEAAAAKER